MKSPTRQWRPGTRTEIAGAWTFVCTGGIQCNHNVSDGGRTGQDSSSILQAGFRLRKNPEQSNALGVVPQVAFDIGSFNRAAGVSGGWGMPRRRPYMQNRPPLVTVWSKLLTFKLINTFASRAARASGRDLVSNFAQTASAKGVHTRMSGHTGGCSCRKQISSGNTLERRYFRPATPKPARTSRTCWSLPGFGRKLPYIVDPDRPVQAIAPCAGTVGRGGPCAEVAGKWRSVRTG
jgi:hypothetical protein